jgi:hypothetical protein
MQIVTSVKKDAKIRQIKIPVERTKLYFISEGQMFFFS